MKKTVLTFSAALLCGFAGFAQSSKGLIAHWDMSSAGADVTGHGHNGTTYGVSAATGRAGVANSALYFNGTGSYIDVPYQSDLNIKKYSLCATVKVTQFNSGSCQANYILSRGQQFTTSNYHLLFYENPYNDCNTFDSTKEVFAAEAGTFTGKPSDWQYSPNIENGQWYSVVATWDESKFRIWVDGKLMSTVPEPSVVPLTSSTAGLLIGRLSTSGGYQYPFSGVMDDLRIYDRVLCENEIVAYYNGSTQTQGGTEVEPDCDSSLSVNRAALEQLSLSPNPATDMLYVKGDAAGSGYRVVNTLGQLAAAGKLSGNTAAVSVAALAPGMYYLQLQRDGAIVTLRFVRE